MDVDSPLFVSGLLNLAAGIVFYANPDVAVRVLTPFAVPVGISDKDLSSLFKSHFYGLVFPAFIAAVGASTVHMATGERNRHRLISLVCACGTIASFAAYQAYATGSRALLVFAAATAFFGAWAYAYSTELAAERREPVHILSPLFWAGLVQGTTGALMYAAPSAALALWSPVAAAFGLKASTLSLILKWPVYQGVLSSALLGFGALAIHAASARDHAHALTSLVCGSGTFALFATWDLVAKGHNWALLFIFGQGALALWAYGAAQNARKDKAA